MLIQRPVKGKGSETDLNNEILIGVHRLQGFIEKLDHHKRLFLTPYTLCLPESFPNASSSLS